MSRKAALEEQEQIKLKKNISLQLDVLQHQDKVSNNIPETNIATNNNLESSEVQDDF